MSVCVCVGVLCVRVQVSLCVCGRVIETERKKWNQRDCPSIPWRSWVGYRKLDNYYDPAEKSIEISWVWKWFMLDWTIMTATSSERSCTSTVELCAIALVVTRIAMQSKQAVVGSHKTVSSDIFQNYVNRLNYRFPKHWLRSLFAIQPRNWTQLSFLSRNGGRWWLA